MTDSRKYWPTIQCRIHIKEVATGNVVSFLDDVNCEDAGWGDPELTGDVDHYVWSEGSFSCDCNRYIFFQRELGKPEDEAGLKCGETRFRVNIENPLSGEIIYREFE